MPDVPYFLPKVSKKDNTTQIHKLVGTFVLPRSQIDKLLIGGCGQNLAHAQLWPYQFKRSSYATACAYTPSMMLCDLSLLFARTCIPTCILCLLSMCSACIQYGCLGLISDSLGDVVHMFIVGIEYIVTSVCQFCDYRDTLTWLLLLVLSTLDQFSTPAIA